MRNQTPIFTLLSEPLIQKNKVKSNHQAHFNTLFSNLYESFSDSSLKWCLVVASEKGASLWLTALPIVEHSFALNKGAFIYAICLDMVGPLLIFPLIAYVAAPLLILTMP